jgi:hypothetical protein
MKLDKNNAVLFYSEKNSDGYLSNWYLCDFKVDNISFHSGEQWFMYSKAMLFGDTEIADIILQTPLKTSLDNKAIKELGRKVSRFTIDIWERHREELIYKGLYEKFRQNDDLKKKLLATGDKLLVEASPYDKIWGIGLSASTPEAWDTDNWKGLNILGKILMRVRENLR